jgi:hypothetical protein
MLGDTSNTLGVIARRESDNPFGTILNRYLQHGVGRTAHLERPARLEAIGFDKDLATACLIQRISAQQRGYQSEGSDAAICF